LRIAVRTLCFLLPILVAVPFDPQWPDFERARRGLLLVLAGAGLLAVGLRKRPAPALLCVAGLAAWALLSMIWARDKLLALEHGAWFCALAAVPLVLPEGRGARRALITGCAAALLLTSLYGIAQSLGLNWPMHYTVPHQPVSSLGNLNVAAEWTAVAAPLAFLASPLLGWPALLAADVYLWANGGRAGLIAFHLALVTLMALRGQHRWRGAVALAALFAVGAVAGTMIRPGQTRSAPSAAAPAPRGDTIRVRMLTWSRALQLAQDNLVLGIGAGNFRVEFPRYRDPAEIAESSHQHTISTRVTMAHNDPIQIACELGIPGAALLILLLVMLGRAAREGRLSGPGIAAVLAFGAVATLRSPTWNAAAAAAALAAVALNLRHRDNRAVPTPLRALRFAGIPLVLLGASILVGESFGADFARAKRTNEAKAGFIALRAAIDFDPCEADWRLLRAQLYHARGKPVEPNLLAGVVADLDAVLERRPGSYRALLDLGYLGLTHKELRDRGRRAVELLLGTSGNPGLDPENPIAILLAGNYAGLAREWSHMRVLARLKGNDALDQAIKLCRGFMSREKDIKAKLEIAALTEILKKLKQ
jgi:hypothetical protein